MPKAWPAVASALTVQLGDMLPAQMMGVLFKGSLLDHPPNLAHMLGFQFQSQFGLRC